MKSTFIEWIQDTMSSDKRIVLLLAGVGGYSFRELPSNRVYDFDVREQAIVGVAAGLAMQGFIPIIFTIAPFLVDRALEQIKLDLCAQCLKVILVSVGASFDYAGEGVSHHCPEDVSLLNSLPNINIAVPSTKEDVKRILDKAVNSRIPEPWYIRLSAIFDTSSAVVHLNQKTAVIAVGNTADLVFASLQEYWHSFDFENIILIKPLIYSPEGYENCEKVLIVEPYYPVLAQEFIRQMNKPMQIRSIGVEKLFYHGGASKTGLMHRSGLSKEHILQVYKELVNDD